MMRSSVKGISILLTAFVLISSFQVFLTPVSAQTIPLNKISPFVSYKFVQSSQNIMENEKISLRDIYYYVSILNLTGSPISEPERSELSSLVLSYQNNDGGFGDWYNDRSKAGSTLSAIRTLKELGASPTNITSLVSFLERLQVSGLAWGNFGFRSSLKERDADISSTYDTLESLRLIGSGVPNQGGVIYYLKDHQNLDGGFGYQTNRDAGIIWDSTVLHSQRGLISLHRFGETPTFETEAVDYILGNQVSNGGFRNQEGEDARVSYTYNAIQALDSMGETIPRSKDVIEFISSNQLASGGFIEYSLDTKEGLHTTFFAVTTLELLGGNYNRSQAAEFAREFFRNRLDGGFGDNPGLGSNSRITFDAVSLLNRIGRNPRDEQAVNDYVTSIRNPDGGYGRGGSSNVETTYRSILTLQILGIPLIEPLSTVQYIRDLQNDDGGFGFASGYVSRGSYTYRAIRTLEILGRYPIDFEGAVSFLRSLQNPDGGFGNYFGEGDSDISSTYRAVRGLSILGSVPVQRMGAIDFIKGSQNEDGGFKRSPADLTAPNNFSTSLFTYNAVMGLYFMGEDVDDRGSVYDFIESLRNPDLGFGEKEFFTSRVSDTFTSIWTYMVLFKDDLDPAPVIGNVSVSPFQPSSTDIVNITAKISDVRDQVPEFVHAEIEGTRYLLQPVGDRNYSISTILPSGSNIVRIIVSDGISQTVSQTLTIEVVDTGNSPDLILFISPDEGSEETEFVFSVSYSHSDGKTASSVQMQLDEGIWLGMQKDIDGTYIFSTTLTPGIHNVRARAFDGINYGYTDRISGPFVHPVNSTRPEWDLFLKIKDLILEEKGVSIDFPDVERTDHNGKLAWKVRTDEGDIFVSYDGENILNGNEGAGMWWIWLLVLVVLLIIAGLGIGTLLYFRKIREEDVSVSRDGEDQ